MTKQRHKIIEILKESSKPLTAEEIYLEAKKEFEAIALTTVYRNLEALIGNHLAQRLMFSDGTARYEYQADEHGHNHFMTCNLCHKSVPLRRCPLEKLSEGIQTETGFIVTGHNIEIYGYCNDCAKKMADQEEKK